MEQRYNTGTCRSRHQIPQLLSLYLANQPSFCHELYISFGPRMSLEIRNVKLIFQILAPSVYDEGTLIDFGL